MKNERRVIVEIITTEKNARNKFAAPLEIVQIHRAHFLQLLSTLVAPQKLPIMKLTLRFMGANARKHTHIKNQLKRRYSLKSAGSKRPYVLE